MNTVLRTLASSGAVALVIGSLAGACGDDATPVLRGASIFTPEYPFLRTRRDSPFASVPVAVHTSERAMVTFGSAGHNCTPGF